MSRRAFALIDDRVDGTPRASEIGDYFDARQRRFRHAQLHSGTGAKERSFSKRRSLRFETVTDCAVEMTDGRVVLRAGHQPVLWTASPVSAITREGRTVGEPYPFGPLEIDEVIERIAGEPCELAHDARRIEAGLHWKVRSPK